MNGGHNRRRYCTTSQNVHAHCKYLHIDGSFMAYLHCRIQTWIRTPNPMATLYYAEVFTVMGSESQFVPESISRNVNEQCITRTVNDTVFTAFENGFSEVLWYCLHITFKLSKGSVTSRLINGRKLVECKHLHLLPCNPKRKRSEYISVFRYV